MKAIVQLRRSGRYPVTPLYFWSFQLRVIRKDLNVLISSVIFKYRKYILISDNKTKPLLVVWYFKNDYSFDWGEGDETYIFVKQIN